MALLFTVGSNILDPHLHLISVTYSPLNSSNFIVMLKSVFSFRFCISLDCERCHLMKLLLILLYKLYEFVADFQQAVFLLLLPFLRRFHSPHHVIVSFK